MAGHVVRIGENYTQRFCGKKRKKERKKEGKKERKKERKKEKLKITNN